MGKDWLFWGGNGSGKSNKKGRSGSGGGGGDKEASSSSAAAPTTGCMCAVLQLFDLHHFPFALHHHHPPPSFKPGSFLQDEPTIRKGLEAPRNSLELEEPFKEVSAASSLSSIMKQEENLNISMNIKIKTSREQKSPRPSTSKARTDDLLSECSSSSSPGAKTPTLVARLMGIDQLPQSSNTAASPSLMHLNSLTNLHMHLQVQQHSMKSRQYLQRGILDNDIAMGTLSLPETPRVSSARRSDVERRLSLQINKENDLGQEFEFSANTARKLARRISEYSKREDDIHNNKEGSHYARQIAKQVKESVSRNFGVDITNKIKSREQQTRDDDHVVLLKSNKPSTTNKVVSDQSPNKPSKHQLVTIAEEQLNHHQLPKSGGLEKCKKDGNEKFKSRLKKPTQISDAIRNKREEPFIRPAATIKVNVTADNKCKKKPLSNDLLNITTVPTLLPIKKDIPFPSSSKFGDEQAYDAQTWRRSSQRLYSSSSPSYNLKKEVTHKFSFQENILEIHCNPSSTSTSQGEHEGEAWVLEYQYHIQRILKRTGLEKSTPVSLAKWYSPSHPLDPSIFHYIELFYPTTPSITPFSNLILRCNRRLIFQLVDELLAEILKPYLNLKPSWSLPRGQMYGSELIDKLCTRIKNFPSANCQVLEDIDALVDSDLRSTSSSEVGKEQYQGEEEKERIMLEIEREILESLLHQTATEVAFG